MERRWNDLIQGRIVSLQILEGPKFEFGFVFRNSLNILSCKELGFHENIVIKTGVSLQISLVVALPSVVAY